MPRTPGGADAKGQQGRPGRRLLLIAWEGADWDVIHPLMDAGQMPALERLVGCGVMGHLATLEPPVSPLRWTTLATGKPADIHRVLGFTSPDPAGQQARPADARDRAVPALWNMFAARGRRPVVVGWPARPAEPVDGIFVTHLFARALGLEDAEVPLPGGVVRPPGSEANLAGLRVHPRELGASELLPFVPGAQAVDQERDPRLAALAVMLAASTSLHAAATRLMQHETWDLTAIHFDFLDRVSHVFMPFHPPRDPNVKGREFELYRHVVAAAYRYADMQLARLMELAGEGTVVALISDHGFHSGVRRPRTIGRGRAFTRWHRPHGIVVLSGPGVRADAWTWGAGPLDVVPTLLTLCGMPVGEDMMGRVLGDAVEPGTPVTSIPSWDAACAPPEGWPEPDPAEVDLELLRLIDEGYVTQDELFGPEAAQRAAADLQFNLAQVHAQAGRTGSAAQILEALHEQAPDDDRIILHLARCYQEQGEFQKCRKLVEYLAGQVIPRQSRHVLKASVWYAEGDFARALEELLLAEQSAPDDPGIHCKIGQAYLRLRNPAEAVRAFSRALSLDANVAHAHHGLSIALIEQGRYEDAARAARLSVGLAYHYPAAHFHLGVALACSERPREAARALETCVAQQPRLAEAHAWLARIYDDELGEPDRAERHRMLARGPGSIGLHEASLDAMMGAD